MCKIIHVIVIIILLTYLFLLLLFLLPLQLLLLLLLYNGLHITTLMTSIACDTTDWDVLTVVVEEMEVQDVQQVAEGKSPLPCI